MPDGKPDIIEGNMSRVADSKRVEPWAGLVALLDPEEGWETFGLLALLFLSTVWVVEGAHWVKDMPPLGWMALGALALGYLLAKIKVSPPLLHPVALIVGAIVIPWQTTMVASGQEFGDKLVDVAVRMYFWYETALSGGISSDPLPFVFQVILLTWLVGYVSAWFVFRSQQVWLGIVPSGVALLVNLTYLPTRFWFNFIIFILASLFLVMRLNVFSQQKRWETAQTAYQRNLWLSMMGPTAWAGAIVLVVAWLIPMLDVSPVVADTWEKTSGPWRNFQGEFDRLFASVSSESPSPLHSFGRALPFRGAVRLGENLPFAGKLRFGRDVVMTVYTDDPGYWRAESYDVYTGQGWLSSERSSYSIPKDEPGRPATPYQMRKEVTMTVEVGMPTDLIVTRGIPYYSSLDAYGETLTPLSYLMSLGEPFRNAALPSDLRALVTELRPVLRSPGRLLTEGEAQGFLPQDVKIEKINRRGAGPDIESIKVRREEPNPPDTSSVRVPNRLFRFQKYTVVSSVSVASGKALREAGTRYPGWVRDRYLQLPASLPERVRRMAQEWSLGADNPYDKVAALEGHLREIPYSLEIEAPPAGADGVDFFLFTQKKGYCDYYAAAMAVMLRALVIPSRVAVGYVTGDYDGERNAYIVREQHAHAWVDAFFPGYGWIEFNPTPAWPSLLSELGAQSELGEEDVTLGDEGLIEGEELLEPRSSGEGSQDRLLLTVLLLNNVFRPLAVMLGVLGALGLILRFVWLYGLSGLDAASTAYEKMCRLATLARLGPRPYQTPGEYSSQLSDALPSAKEKIVEIVHGYLKAQFGKSPPQGEDEQKMEKAWQEIRGKLLIKVLRWKQR